tara:strand:- start:186 stop:761 length:576 start_codon:yes stop_codon:yes gene_type:complete
MPIVITPSGEYVDSVTGNPVQMTNPPMDNMAQRLSQGMGQRTGATPTAEELQSLEGAMARENIPANLDMGMDSEMAAADLSDVDKVRMLIDMGLNPQEAMEVIAREKTGSAIAPQEFGRVVGMQGGQQMADPMMQQQQMQQSPQPMGALPMARPTPPMPMQRPFDISDMSPEQRDMVRRGIDPFAEGMMGR